MNRDRSPDGALRAFTPVFNGLWRNPGAVVPHGTASKGCAAVRIAWHMVQCGGGGARRAAVPGFPFAASGLQRAINE
jgi:hypothetical protein